MSKYDDELKAKHLEHQVLINSVSDKIESTMEADVEQFQHNTLDNIPQNFGKFLYTALGDRVTGQRSSVLNETYFYEGAGRDIQRSAIDKGTTVEKECKLLLENKYYYDTRWSETTQPHLYITVGRKFGVSYLTGNGDRVHTIFFGAGRCFEYLTQEHVDCVKDKLKRACTQDFLNFRDAFINGLDTINREIISTPVPIKVGVSSCITKRQKLHNANNEQYIIMDDIVDSNVTHTLVSVQNLPVWDKKSCVYTYRAKDEEVLEHSYISLTFLNINSKDETVQVLGNVDMSMDELAHSLDMGNNFHSSKSTDHVSCYDRSSVLTGEYQWWENKEPDGVMLNMDEVLNDSKVKQTLTRTIKFYNEMSVKLQELKHKHSTLYFFNADM